jgi:hypothetical protein
MQVDNGTLSKEQTRTAADQVPTQLAAIALLAGDDPNQRVCLYTNTRR